jgi:integrase
MARPGKKRLTPLGINKLKQEGYYADSEAVGLYVQVAHRQQDGKLDKKHGITKSWIYRYTSPTVLNAKGKPAIRWMGLGACDVIELREARQLAKAARRLVTLGADPIEYREETKAAEHEDRLKEQASRMTFAACAEAYAAEHLKKFRNAKHRSQWQRSLDLASQAFGDLNVAAIDGPCVIKFLTPIWAKTPESASRIRGRVEQVLDWARVHQFRDGANPARWKGHLEHVFAVAEGGNFRAMPYSSVPGFVARLRERDSASARALEFLILTAARSGEVRGATWSEVDLDNKLWTIPAERMKAGKQHEVPLSKQAVTLLKALPHVGLHVFPGAVENKPLSDMALTQLMRGMNETAQVHGMRSAFRDWAGDLGHFDPEVIEHALAHRLPSATQRAYRRGTALPKRIALMQAWANYLDQAEVADNIRQLHG